MLKSVRNVGLRDWAFSVVWLQPLAAPTIIVACGPRRIRAAMSTTYDTDMFEPLAIGNCTLKAEVSDEVRLELVWRAEPPAKDPVVASLAVHATVTGRRWSVHLPVGEAREALGSLTSGPAFAALDDFTLATPTLEDVYLALGGRARDLERA